MTLSLPDVSWTFWDPFARDEQLQRAAEQPGIYTAITLDQNHVRLVYDPGQLTEEEAVQSFERTTGLDAEIDR